MSAPLWALSPPDHLLRASTASTARSLLPGAPRRAVAQATSPAAQDKAQDNGAIEAAASSASDKPFINHIPRSRWADGIPPVMGAHLMASTAVAPLSTSKGPGLGGVPHLFSYPKKEIFDTEVLKFEDGATGARGLAALVQEAAAAAIEERGAFTLVLSGGSLLKALGQVAGLEGLDFARWHVFYADERNVPHASDESNHKGARDAFLSKVSIPEAQVHAIAEGLPVDQAATEYAGQLLRLPPDVLPRTSDGQPAWDLVLLGAGPDGHVASLFPNSHQLSPAAGATAWVLPVTNSPKPPPERITLSLPAINSAKQIAIVAFGGGKAEIVQRCLEVQALPGALPAQLVRPSNGRLRWLLDADSAADLKLQSWQDPKAHPRSDLPKAAKK